MQTQTDDTKNPTALINLISIIGASLIACCIPVWYVFLPVWFIAYGAIKGALKQCL